MSPPPSQAPRLPHAPGAPVRAGIPEHGRMPKYYLAKAQLTELLDELGEGATLPAERELAERYGVARETLRLALRELLLEGRVRRQGRGTVVAGPKIEQPLALGSYTEGVRKRGHTPGRRLIGLERFAADADAASELGVERGDFVWHLERVLLVDDERVGLESTYAPVALLPRLDDDFDPVGSFYAYARDAGGLVSGGGEERIETVLATPREALLIGTPPALPMLLLHRRSWDVRGRAFERVRTLYRGDRFSFSTELRAAE
ncbi:GntR family transcriptional regulator [Streptacidiphilus jiangxiensis]|uniref:GntR family transcriptional regulator n=1 Tax=Streptacidiphilus jiangxiensis TaxID=235985 RepID=A0A1H7RIZ9_STRJI|nr:GntR family transcriptional regulator [Streptacidiphilus jiangxiensis]SEL60065.1 GntR family transcriptional regulator [Streptacidiphilus jiangxiensis]